MGQMWEVIMFLDPSTIDGLTRLVGILALMSLVLIPAVVIAGTLRDRAENDSADRV